MLDSLGDAKGAGRLRRASTQGPRHTDASHAIARGIRVETEKEILGRASLATTDRLCDDGGEAAYESHGEVLGEILMAWD